MGVAFGHLYVGVAEEITDDAEGDPLLKHGRGKRVAQAMPADRADTCAPTDAPQSMSGSAVPDGMAFLVLEHVAV